MRIPTRTNEDGSTWTPITVCAEDLLNFGMMLTRLGQLVDQGQISKKHAALHIGDMAIELGDMLEEAFIDAGMEPGESYEFAMEVGNEYKKEIAEMVKQWENRTR